MDENKLQKAIEAIESSDNDENRGLFVDYLRSIAVVNPGRILWDFKRGFRLSLTDYLKGSFRFVGYNDEVGGTDKDEVELKAILKIDVEMALENLCELDREIILLRFYRGLECKEIAKMLKLSVEGVRVRLHRALKRLRKLMEEAGYEGLKG